jgi:3alpha(or 20beta)-hydroxysteroid dehydrogenase
MSRLSGKVALITGAARGQGAAEARLFAEEGAAVVVTDVLDEPGETLAAMLRSRGWPAGYRRLDTASPEHWRSAIDHVREAHGRLDVLVNNAGVAQRSGLLDTSLDEWETVLRINLTGAFIGIQAAAALMGRGGSIVNVLLDRRRDRLASPRLHREQMGVARAHAFGGSGAGRAGHPRQRHPPRRDRHTIPARSAGAR